MSTLYSAFLSCSLYIMHYPLVYMQMKWVVEHPHATFAQHVFVNVALFILAVGMAYGALKAFDIPIREWLKHRWLHKNKL